MNKNTIKIVSAGGLALCIIATIGHACQDETTLDYLRRFIGIVYESSKTVLITTTIVTAVSFIPNIKTNGYTRGTKEQ